MQAFLAAYKIREKFSGPADDWLIVVAVESLAQSMRAAQRAGGFGQTATALFVDGEGHSIACDHVPEAPVPDRDDRAALHLTLAPAGSGLDLLCGWIRSAARRARSRSGRTAFTGPACRPECPCAKLKQALGAI